MKPTIGHDELLGELAREKKTIDQFIGLLGSESQALVDCDPDSLEKHFAGKRMLIGELEQFSAVRRQQLDALGLPATPDGVHSLIEKHAEASPGVRALWSEIERRARRAKAINETNGVLIRSQLKHTHNQLAALQQAAYPPRLYSADGSARGIATSRTLGVV